MHPLEEVDLSQKLDGDEYDERLEAAQDRLLQLRLLLGGQTGTHELGPPVCVLFEGWDASGKGGALKRMVYPLDPRHVRVVGFAAPSADEKRHHYLQRFWPHLPGRGGMTVLDRSWYGRLLVERVEGFATEAEWRRAYDEIPAFERMLTDDGMCLIKFWMHVSDEEQLRRFEKRRDNPLKSWKLTSEDWRNRERRSEYEAALQDMFEHTDTENAPWHIVAGDQKKFARIQVIDTVNERIEAAMQASGQAVPPPPSDDS